MQKNQHACPLSLYTVHEVYFFHQVDLSVSNDIKCNIGRLKWYQMQCLQNLPNLCQCRTPLLCTWCIFCLPVDFSSLGFLPEWGYLSRLNINIFNIYNVHNIYSNTCRINTSSRFLSLNVLSLGFSHQNEVVPPQLKVPRNFEILGQ